MGWLFQHGANRADIIARCTEAQDNAEARWTTLAHCTKGNVLWTVFEVFHKHKQETVRFIGCFLLGRSHDGWGYKDLCESMGPLYYSCPLRYLDMAPVANAEWRQQVREWHARMSRHVAVGDVWSLIGCTVPDITITSVRPLRGTRHGMRYRLSRKLLGERLSQGQAPQAPTVKPGAVASQDRPPS